MQPSHPAPRALSLLTSLLIVGCALAAPASIHTSTRLLHPTDELADSDCSLSGKESALLERIRQHPEQRRSRLRCDASLTAFARSRALDMARRDYFAHVNPDHQGPNLLLKNSGYPLPGYYAGIRANSIESIAGGYADPHTVFDRLMQSESHRAHLLALEAFFEDQDEIGVAHVHAQQSEMEDYWVIVIARRRQPDDPHYVCTPEPVLCIEFGG